MLRWGGHKIMMLELKTDPAPHAPLPSADAGLDAQPAVAAPPTAEGEAEPSGVTEEGATAAASSE